jgi:hypothetical protein
LVLDPGLEAEIDGMGWNLGLFSLTPLLSAH